MGKIRKLLSRIWSNAGHAGTLKDIWDALPSSARGAVTAALIAIIPSGILSWQIFTRGWIVDNWIITVGAIGIVLVSGLVGGVMSRSKGTAKLFKRWYFRLSQIKFDRRSLESTEYIISIDLMVSNRLPDPASISHFILEVIDSDGNKTHLNPSDRKEVGAPFIGNTDELIAPLYLLSKEVKVGQVTFLVPNSSGFRTHGPLNLFLRDEEGTEYRMPLDGKTMVKIASISRKEDYPN